MATLGRWLKGFGAFWWDFLVGDDWRIAVGVIVGLALTAVLVRADVPAWWVLPVAALALLAFSLWRAVRPVRRSRRRAGAGSDRSVG